MPGPALQRSLPSSRSSSFLERIDSIDKTLSKPFFLACLPRPAEYVLSLPGNFFGLPFFALAVAPNLTAAFFLMYFEREAPQRWWGLLLVLCVFFLGCWAQVIKGNMKFARWMYGSGSFFPAPVIGILLLQQLGEDSLSIQRIAYFQSAAWCIGVIPVAFLKPAVARMRPVKWCHHHSSDELKMEETNNDQQESNRVVATTQKAALESKHLGILPRLFHMDGMKSFPSGDAAGALAISYPLLRCGEPSGQAIAACCVLGSGVGRMFWQAHHLGDVLVGVVVSLGSCWCWEQAVGAFSQDRDIVVEDMDLKCRLQALWWHPLAAQALLGTIVIVTRALTKSRQIFRGTIRVDTKEK